MTGGGVRGSILPRSKFARCGVTQVSEISFIVAVMGMSICAGVILALWMER